METTWRIKPNVVWHDGATFTTEDILFTETVLNDRDLALATARENRLIESIDAPDARTITVRWKQPYIWADAKFASLTLMPKHLLERPFAEKKEGFLGLAYWGQEFVGTGPYKMREWVTSSHLLLDANPQYAVGRPRIDRIEIRFIPDANALVTNVLAGTVDLVLSRGIALDQALLLRDQWQGGRVAWTPGLSIMMYPQLLPPTPPMIADVRFRRALLHGANRQELVDTLMGGLSTVAHITIVNPNQREYQEVEANIVKYEYAPRRATQLLEEIGLSKGPDGFYRAAGTSDRLTLGVYTSPSNSEKVRAMYAMTDAWQRLGLNVEPNVFSIAQVNDNEYLSVRPGFYHVRHPHSLVNLEQYWTSGQARTAQTQYRGGNYTGYSNAELDSLIERFNVSIPRAERMQALAPIVRHITEQAVVLGLFYDGETSAVATRLKNVPDNEGADRMLRVHEWDVE
jgi:peptide/nickel transport system substrate-binding protein